MEPCRVMNAVDEEDQPKVPAPSLGHVTQRGLNFLNGINHAHHVNENGHCDLLR